jgi:hypothetical protein
MRSAKPGLSRGLLLLAGVLLAAAVPQASDLKPVSLSVRPVVLFAGRDVRATVRTPRDPRNRELRVIVEGADYYASSEVQLDGDGAPATHQFTWKELPAGAYRAEAILSRENGERETVAQCFAVLGLDEESNAEAVRPQPQPQRGGRRTPNQPPPPTDLPSAKSGC